jgi:hypothetical protein
MYDTGTVQSSHQLTLIRLEERPGNLLAIELSIPTRKDHQFAEPIPIKILLGAVH